MVCREGSIKGGDRYNRGGSGVALQNIHCPIFRIRELYTTLSSIGGWCNFSYDIVHGLKKAV